MSTELSNPSNHEIGDTSSLSSRHKEPNPGAYDSPSNDHCSETRTSARDAPAQLPDHEIPDAELGDGSDHEIPYADPGDSLDHEILYAELGDGLDHEIPDADPGNGSDHEIPKAELGDSLNHEIPDADPGNGSDHEIPKAELGDSLNHEIPDADPGNGSDHEIPKAELGDSLNHEIPDADPGNGSDHEIPKAELGDSLNHEIPDADPGNGSDHEIPKAELSDSLNHEIPDADPGNGSDHEIPKAELGDSLNHEIPDADPGNGSDHEIPKAELSDSLNHEIPDADPGNGSDHEIPKAELGDSLNLEILDADPGKGSLNKDDAECPSSSGTQRSLCSRHLSISMDSCNAESVMEAEPQIPNASESVPQLRNVCVPSPSNCIMDCICEESRPEQEENSKTLPPLPACQQIKVMPTAGPGDGTTTLITAAMVNEQPPTLSCVLLGENGDDPPSCCERGRQELSDPSKKKKRPLRHTRAVAWARAQQQQQQQQQEQRPWSPSTRSASHLSCMSSVPRVCSMPHLSGLSRPNSAMRQCIQRLIVLQDNTADHGNTPESMSLSLSRSLSLSLSRLRGRRSPEHTASPGMPQTPRAAWRWLRIKIMERMQRGLYAEAPAVKRDTRAAPRMAPLPGPYRTVKRHKPLRSQELVQLSGSRAASTFRAAAPRAQGTLAH